ncbi:putative gibberellin 20-oxidase [Pseudovirgaria hyperparasitica]|uniref:Putative gibberellin 20-oxidase n=1 Tax=Pseudovirgaria hyperparasitica TaxID=470096 RepID=A0A6A6WHX5_9PEZI|nr:putative gibberellin 20-oxidase [Pseudovirgaria hyperparasitica]KAF2760751.1 putative gibberellin 20-oxidase [Pseudovirgaria hyperparasitica]
MSTSFSSLPFVDLSALSSSTNPEENHKLGKQLYDVFSTTGFAYLVNTPLSFSHGEVLDLAREFFSLPMATKMEVAKHAFKKDNTNTYHGYFPPQPGSPDNLKEGFEIGPSEPPSDPAAVLHRDINLNEANVWPAESAYKSRHKLEKLHGELQALSYQLLSLLAVSLGKPAEHFAHYLQHSISTLRLLHYPPQEIKTANTARDEQEARLCCTPHTDSGILTLLHQDATGGLEVLNAAGAWIQAPYVADSIVVNIGDLMARVSGGRFVATMHRVKASIRGQGVGRMGRFSVPFFFEPGENCVIKSVDGDDEGVLYGHHVRAKMSSWVEFQGHEDGEERLPGRY